MHLQQPYIPGLGYQENYLPFKQRALKHEVYLISSTLKCSKFKSKKLKNLETSQYIKKGVHIHRLNSWFKFKPMDMVFFKGLTEKISEINPDVIHSHGILSPFTRTASKYSSNHNDVKLFVDCHIDNDNFHLDRKYKKLVFFLFKKFFLQKIVFNTEKFLPVNPYAAQFLSKEYNIDTSEIELLPLGVDSTQFNPDKDQRCRIRDRLGIKEDETLLIHSGNFEPTKDIDVLIKSFAKIKERYDNVKLLLLGKGDDSYMRKVRKWINEKKVEDSIIFHDFVDHSELPSFYNAADVGVYPGKLGITIIEAVGTGLPVIVSDSKATNYIISNDNGFSIERGSVEELTHKIKKYIQNEKLRKQHQKNAVELVEKELSWRKIAEKSIDIYRKNNG